MSQGGYPLEWFSEPLDNSLKCGICTKILRDPRVTPCGHIYCSYCLITWLNSYGVCPRRCKEVEVESLRRRVQLDTFISGLFIYCTNKRAGCTEQVPLIEKHLHENICPHSSIALRIANDSCTNWRESVQKPRRGKHKRTNSSVSASSSFAFSSTASATAAKRLPSAAQLCRAKDRLTPAAVRDMNSKGIYSTHTFRLKRPKAREPLGLVLVSGEKTQDGRSKSFYVKKVHTDTLGWKAGVQANDRIVQVDFHDLASMNPEEAVARIKEKPLVILTVIRGLEPYPPHNGQGADDHVYDEIYSDCQLSQHLSQSLSQLDENTPINNGSTISLGYPISKNKSGKVPASAKLDDKNHQRSRTQKVQLSPLSVRSLHLHKDKQSGCKSNKHPRALEGESKDSGLSSGSSTHQDNDDSHQGRHMFAPSPPVGDSSHHQFCRTPSGSSGGSEQHTSNIHCHIEGEYEIEEIYLRKNGTSQLGITLGYNMDNKTEPLQVCEVVPNGLAAQNGRLRSGDIIQMVNGFEVHDTEEAILLFLEQNQDITLTVARPAKVSSWLRETPPPPPRINHHIPSNDQSHDYAVLETTRTMLKTFRRVDSCGTLDSTCNHPPVLPFENLDIVDKNAFRRVDSCGTLNNKINRHIPSTNVEDMDALANKQVQQISSYDLMRRTRSTGSVQWSAKAREGRLKKSKTPPVLARRTSPLVSQQQQQEQQPIYHVLQQPTSPMYHVLQQPLLSPSSTQEKKFTFSEQSKNSLLQPQRPSSACPPSRYKVNSSSSWEGHADNTHPCVPPPTSRSIPNEMSLLRSEVTAVDFSPESLV